jgi:hypothetical protein
MITCRTIVSCSLALLAIQPPLQGASPEESLRAAATQFCTELRKESIRGIPTAEQWDRGLGSLVTPELRSVFDWALHWQKDQIKKSPDEKPDWIEGDLFGSSYGGVTSWDIGEVIIRPGGDPTVRIHNAYAVAGQDPVVWFDSLVFKERNGRWLVDDIRLGSDWDYATGKSLRSGLPGGIKEDGNHDSLDGRWRLTFTREADEITKIEIAPTDGSKPPAMLYGEGNESCPFPTFVLWSPGCDMLAISLGEGIRYRRSLVYRWIDSEWRMIDGLEEFPEKKHAWLADDLHERNRTIEAIFWQDAKTVVLQYFGIYVKQDGSDLSAEYDELLSVRIDGDGGISVVESVETPYE